MNKIFKCLCCEKQDFIQQHALQAHLKSHNLTKKEYYDKYLRKDGEGNCKECGKETLFRGNSYLTFCSKKCADTNIDVSEKRRISATGRKQSLETIKRRIDNTDQLKKEANRQETMISRYGQHDILAGKTSEEKDKIHRKIGLTHRGSKHTKEQHAKVIATKIANCTLKHTKETKLKMSLSHKRNYAQDNPPNCIPKEGSGGKGYSCGYVGKLYYRSSYEKIFLETCEKFSLNVESAATKHFRMQYSFEGKRHFYYPDFYLPDYDIIVEIKPVGKYLDAQTFEKIETGINSNIASDFLMLTEDELFDENFYWVKELEYFCTIY